MPKFTVTQICYFSAAHKLREYQRACDMLHGHNYKVLIEISAAELNNLGMVMDYYDIQEVAQKFIKQLDHKYLNDLSPFDKINPSAENVAKWLFDNISENITSFNKENNSSNSPKLESITIWETDHNFVKYTN